MKKKDVTVFKPVKGKPMIEAYPELGKYDEFKNIPDTYIRYAWYFGNRSSPFYNENSHYRKTTLCFKQAFGKLTQGNTGIAKRLHENDVPEEIINAIERMRKFNPSIRDKALSLQEKIFEHYETIVDKFQEYIEADAEANESDNAEEGKKGKRLSIGATKDYVELTAKINKELPSLILNLEEGFGVKRGKDELHAEDEFVDEIENIIG